MQNFGKLEKFLVRIAERNIVKNLFQGALLQKTAYSKGVNRKNRKKKIIFLPNNDNKKI